MKDKPGEEFEDDDNVDSIAFNLRVQREEQQKEVFTKWINHWFAHAKSESRVYDLYFNFSDGILLGELLSIVTNGQFTQKCDHVNNRIVHILNVRVCLNYLNSKYHGFDDLDAVDIVDQKHNLILKLVWQLFLIFHEPPVDDGKVKDETDGDKKDMSSDNDFEHIDLEREIREGNLRADKNNNIENETIGVIGFDTVDDQYPKHEDPITNLTIDSPPTGDENGNFIEDSQTFKSEAIEVFEKDCIEVIIPNVEKVEELCDQLTEDLQNNIENAQLSELNENEALQKDCMEIIKPKIENVEELLNLIEDYKDDIEKVCDIIEQGSKVSKEKACQDMGQTGRETGIGKQRIDTQEAKVESSPSSSRVEILQSNSNSENGPTLRRPGEEMRNINRERLTLAVVILAIFLVCAQKCWLTLYDYVALDSSCGHEH